MAAYRERIADRELAERLAYVGAVVVVGPNTWGAFEIKLNPDAVDEAAAALLRFKANVDTSRHGDPACLGVITSTGAGGLRDDGVHVIPIGCLGP